MDFKIQESRDVIVQVKNILVTPFPYIKISKKEVNISVKRP